MSEPRSRTAEFWLLITLAAIQFTHVVDFMIIMPLGPVFKEVFHIDSSRFGILVAVYQFSAGAAGLLGSTFADRFDRKQFLLTLYIGFILSTVGCALAPDYETLLLCRILAGACGGLMSSTILAIVGDEVPPQRRGHAMGIVMGSFSIASALGVPLGLMLADAYSWHAPFYFLGIFSLPILLIGLWRLPAMRSHLQRTTTGRSPLAEAWNIVIDPSHLAGFGLVATIMIGSFMVVPYISDTMVANAGIRQPDLKYIYLLGGITTIISMPLAGRLADKFGETRVFTIASFLTVIPIVIVTNLGNTPLWAAVGVTAMFMSFSSSRMVPAISLVTQSVEPHKRGRYMSVNTAVREMVNALAVYIGGLILIQGVDGHLHNYEIIGYIGVASTLLAIPIVFKIRKVS